MLESITFTNFKCFHKQTIAFRPSTIVVGRNNAGKSTIVEALRLVALVANRAEHLRFHAPPSWTERHRNHRGLQPAFDDLDINFEAVFHRYSDPPASIFAKFSNGSSVEVLLGLDNGTGGIHGIIKNHKGKIAQTHAELGQAAIPRIAILPQVGPVNRAEGVLNAEHVRRNLSTSLAPRHFRNQINLLYNFYADFRKIAEETWPGLRIDTFSGHGGKPGDPLKLLVQNDDFVAEIGWMGHGLQMWLQTMWFLARSRSAKIVMLDEPDVYMHPDLQRRLIRFLRERFPQMIITTHSVEMLSEVGPEEMLIIDRKRTQSGFADTMPVMQRAIDGLGALHNIQLSRLWGARKLLLVEGDDMQILRRFHDLISPDSLDSFASIPNLSIGGWGGWSYAVGSSMLLQNAGGDDISAYCLLDSDYHTPNELAARRTDAITKNVRLHIWQRKEIENYLISPEAIKRVITEKSAKPPSVETIQEQLFVIAERHRDAVYDCLAESFRIEDKGKHQQTANAKARQALGGTWTQASDGLLRVSGKVILSEISEWSKKEYGVSFGISALLRNMRREDVPAEAVAVISAIEDNEQFSAAD